MGPNERRGFPLGLVSTRRLSLSEKLKNKFNAAPSGVPSGFTSRFGLMRRQPSIKWKVGLSLFRLGCELQSWVGESFRSFIARSSETI